GWSCASRCEPQFCPAQSVDQITARNARLAFPLYFEQVKQSLPGADEGFSAFDAHHPRLSRTGYGARAVHAQRTPGGCPRPPRTTLRQLHRVTSGSGVEAAHAVVDRLGGQGPVDATVFLADLGGGRREVMILRPRHGPARFEVIEGREQQVAAHEAEALEEFARGFIGADRRGLLRDHFTVIDFRVETEDGDPRLLVAVRDGPL